MSRKIRDPGAMQVSGNASAGASGFGTHRKRRACSLGKTPEGGWASDAGMRAGELRVTWNGDVIHELVITFE